MTFVIDRTRSFLKIDSSVLLSLHRSITPIAPAEGHCQGHLCDAFICSVLEYNLHRVYLALHDQQTKANLVFIADPVKPDSKKLEALLLEGHGFLENIGFRMEEVNLNFSSATREVIIKDIRVMREPSLPLQLDAANAALEALATEKKEIIQKASRELVKLRGEVENLRGQLATATAVQQAPVAEPPAEAESRTDSALQAELDELHIESGTLREEGEGVRLRLRGAENELQQLREELGNVKATLKSTREGLKNAKEESKQARKELKLSKQESDELHEKLASEQMELEKSRDEIEDIRRQLQEARKVFESELHDRTANNDEIESARKTELADLKKEINRLMNEQADHDFADTGKIELLQTALADANASLSAEKAKNESVLQEVETLKSNSAAELELMKKKVDSLTAEKKLLEKISADIKIKASEEIERQEQVNQSQRKAAIKKLHALKEEIRQLTESRADIVSPTMMPFAQSGNKVLSFPSEDRKEIPVVTQHANFSSDPFGSAEATGSIDFLPDKSLKGIPYSFSTDVVEIYRSYNTIHAAPNGKQAQKCDGFVCLVTEEGQSLVYVAWLMNSSGEVMVCLPECGAVGGDSCRQILREGIGYFERIGFIIDSFHLEEEPGKRQVQLDNLAVFYRNITDCAA